MPDCPRCGTPMQLRIATTGYNQGKQFYGCINYPHCKGAVNLEQVKTIENEKLIKDGKSLIKQLRYEGFELLEKVSRFHPKYNIIKKTLPNLKKEVNQKNYNRGNRLFKEKKWDKAIEVLKQIPVNSEFYYKVKRTIEEAANNYRKEIKAAIKISQDRAAHKKLVKYKLNSHGDIVKVDITNFN